ncbi:Holliday junction branch migration protein RuvA [Patescibacteria group bacterium]|nr:MAG: Holliday junction branch migration protein RuvA [Patescibacteria group bacterium]
MIATLEGTITAKEENRAIVEVAGIGYEVALTAPTAVKLAVGERVRLCTMEVTREDSHELFGFADEAARALFRKLIAVSGVGPRTALQVMSIGATSEVRLAIDAGDISRLTSVPGVGTKTAQKIILELRGKLAEAERSEDRDVVEALAGLGYRREEAAQAVASLPSEVKGDEARLRAALRLLGGKK